MLTIEAIPMPGKGKMTVTGNLRDVMKESISAAASFVRSRAMSLVLSRHSLTSAMCTFTCQKVQHQKMGPSAGIAMATAIISAMTGIPIRRDIAITGEVTLRGRVLPIGGLKEKLSRRFVVVSKRLWSRKKMPRTWQIYRTTWKTLSR